MNSTMNSPSCPVCRSPNTKFLFDSWDFAHGYPGKFPLWKCKSCGHIHLAGEFTPEMLTDMYSNYYPRSTFDPAHWQPYSESTGLLDWLDGQAGCHRWVPKNVRVLDIGCGNGETLGYHQARGCEVWGCEADANVKKIADKYGFNIHIGLFDSKNYEKNYFDYVTMNHVIEHVSDPFETLRQVRSVLKPNGKLIFCTPFPYSIDRYFFGRYWLGWHTPFHLHLFSKRSAAMLLDKTGFTLERTVSRTPSIRLLNHWGVLFVHGKEGVPMNFTSASSSNYESFGSEKESLWYIRLYRLLEKSRLFSAVSKLSDMFGLGSDRIYAAVKKD